MNPFTCHEESKQSDTQAWCKLRRHTRKAEVASFYWLAVNSKRLLNCLLNKWSHSCHSIPLHCRERSRHQDDKSPCVTARLYGSERMMTERKTWVESAECGASFHIQGVCGSLPGAAKGAVKITIDFLSSAVSQTVSQHTVYEQLWWALPVGLELISCCVIWW